MNNYGADNKGSAAINYIATYVPTEKVTYLDHVLDPTVGVLLNNRFNPDQGLHLGYKQHTYFTHNQIDFKQVPEMISLAALHGVLHL